MTEPLHVGVIGATGFIGAHTLAALRGAGHHPVAFTRRRGVRVPGAAETRLFDPAGEPALADLDAVINLAGSPILCRWTRRNKQRILASRLHPTRQTVRAIARARALSRGPNILISASGTGYYGGQDPRAEPLDESAPQGADFLARTAALWENEALQAAALPGVRVVTLRIGFVTGPDGGAIPLIRRLFKTGLGGPLGSGRQWMSWIHVTDLARLIVHLLHSPQIAGPVNAVAPAPVTNREFTRALAAAVRRPALLPAPAPLLRLLLGEMSDLLLSSNRVISSRLGGFDFLHPEIGPALQACL